MQFIKDYEMVCGLEVHVELATKTKIFCSCPTTFGAEPNTQCCPVCTGMPGTLPVLNKQVVDYAVKAGIATNCEIARYSKEDRKNYFYPDLPKAYQISQYDLPLCEHGWLEIETDNGTKKIGITRIHIEEDAGKLMHDDTHGTMIDCNRCGVPLIEIVSEPDIRTAEEAVAYVRKLRAIMLYTGVSDCRMNEGSLRCDVNLSVRKRGEEKFGTRTEMKNINSFSAAERAIEYEVNRQIDVVSEGGTITQETRRWDDSRGKNMVMRSKEDAQDYRYFPDPDLVAVEISDEWLEQIRSEIPELPQSRYNRYMEEIGLQPKEARILADSFDKACLLDEGVNMQRVDAKNIANWILSDISKYLNDKNLELKDTKLTAQKLVDMIELIEKNTISGNAGKKVLVQLFETDDSVDTIVDKLGLKQVSDEGAIQKLVDEVLAANPKSVADYKKGKKNAIGFLVGQCMKASKGKGNPKMINQLLSKTLDSME